MNGALLQYAGSLFAVLLLIFVAWRLRLGGDPEIADETEARELADNALCGFAAERIALDRGKRGALLRDRDGRILLLAPHGNRFVARLLDAKAHAEVESDRLNIVTGEPRLAGVQLELADAAAWCEAIKGLE